MLGLVLDKLLEDTTHYLEQVMYPRISSHVPNVKLPFRGTQPNPEKNETLNGHIQDYPISISNRDNRITVQAFLSQKPQQCIGTWTFPYAIFQLPDHKIDEDKNLKKESNTPIKDLVYCPDAAGWQTMRTSVIAAARAFFTMKNLKPANLIVPEEKIIEGCPVSLYVFNKNPNSVEGDWYVVADAFVEEAGKKKRIATWEHPYNALQSQNASGVNTKGFSTSLDRPDPYWDIRSKIDPMVKDAIQEFFNKKIKKTWL